MKPPERPEEPYGKPLRWYVVRVLAFFMVAPLIFFSLLYRLRKWFGLEFDLPDLTIGVSPLIFVVGFLGISVIFASLTRATHRVSRAGRDGTISLSFRYETWHVKMAASVFVGGSIILSALLLLLSFEWLWIGVGVLVLFGISTLLFLGVYVLHIVPQIIYYYYHRQRPPLLPGLPPNDNSEVIVPEERIKGSEFE